VRGERTVAVEVRGRTGVGRGVVIFFVGALEVIGGVVGFSI